jgi:structural maintenance of chromosome 4
VTNPSQELDTKKEELQSLKTELDAKTTELNECRGVEIEMRNNLEQIEKTSQDAQKRFAHWEEELGKLELKNTTHAPPYRWNIADPL